MVNRPLLILVVSASVLSEDSCFENCPEAQRSCTSEGRQRPKLLREDDLWFPECEATNSVTNNELNLAQRHALQMRARIQTNPSVNGIATGAFSDDTSGLHPSGSSPLPQEPGIVRALKDFSGKQLAAYTRHLQLSIPVSALLLGILFICAGRTTVGIIVGYFGAQSGMSLYMKLILSDTEISQELGLKGVPAAFLVTAIQQCTAFVLFSIGMGATWLARCRRPKTISSSQEVCMVCCLGLAFAANIGLNNFSLSLISVAMNLVMRSCLPLFTLMLQLVIGLCKPSMSPNVRSVEVSVMLTGVLCAAVMTMAKMQTSESRTESEHLMLGVCVGMLSVCAAAFDLIFGSILWKTSGFGPFETTWYMSLPATLFLIPPALFLSHPVEWPGYGTVTDTQVFSKVFELSPGTFGLVMVSGVFSVSYNLLRYAMVQALSATHTAFAGNFNKAITILISIGLGLEKTPGGTWNTLMMLSIAGSITAFTAYSLISAPEPSPSLLSVPVLEDQRTISASSSGIRADKRVQFTETKGGNILSKEASDVSNVA